MQLQPFVEQVQSQLTAAASLGDDRTRHTAEALAVAAEPATRLAILAAVTAAADEITAALLDTPGSPAVSVRMDGGEVQVSVRAAESTPPPAAPQSSGEDADSSARISLRLSEALKTEIESAARAAAVSVNTWLVRAAAAALAGATASARGPESGEHRGRGTNAHRITGWING